MQVCMNQWRHLAPNKRLLQITGLQKIILMLLFLLRAQSEFQGRANAVEAGSCACCCAPGLPGTLSVCPACWGTELQGQLGRSKAALREMLKAPLRPLSLQVGLFCQHIGGEGKGESRKQISRAAVQALTALLCAETGYLHFLQVKG